MSAVITDIKQLDLVNGTYTYADYVLWRIKDRLEILRGKVFKMSPTPAISHQKVATIILKGKLVSFLLLLLMWYLRTKVVWKTVWCSPTFVWYATLKS